MSIPTSILGTFMVLYFMDFTLNLFTLLALSLSIGIVVDDAIMVLENIVRHYEMGKDRKTAAGDGAREITSAAVAATLAVVAVFLPIALVQGVIGKFLFQFGITLCAAVLLSLVEAITLTPMRCSQFLSVGGADRSSNIIWRSLTWPLTFLSNACKNQIQWLAGKYHTSLAFTLKYRYLTVFVITILWLVSMIPVKFLPKEFNPSQDQSMILVKYETPIGSSLEHTRNILSEAEKLIMARPEVRTYFLAVGGFQGETVNSGIMFVSLKSKKERSLSQQKLQEIFRTDLNKIKDLKAFVIDLSKGGPNGGLGFPITFSLQGPSLAVLKEESAKLMQKMKDEKLAVDIDTDYKEGQPEYRIYVDRDKASRRGVTVQTISDTVTAAFGGVREGKFTNEDRRYDVRIRVLPDNRTKKEDLLNLQIRNIYGELIPIGEIITIEKVDTVQTIARRNRERSISIQANPAPGVAENTALNRIEQIAKEQLPPGYRLLPSDTAKTNKEFGEQIIFALGMGILVAYMVLAAQFNSYGHPFIILLAIPFAISGAFIGLLITGQTLNLYSFIGLVLLMGIVKKNSILLVEFTNQIREHEGLNVRESLLKAGPIRLRPILMTSIATIAAAIPPALAIGPGAESRIPMSVTIIAGTLFSTISTLFLVPSSYSIFESIKAWTQSKTHFGEKERNRKRVGEVEI